MEDTLEPIANIDVEQALLGAILVNNGAFTKVKKFLAPESFFEPTHKKIFQAMTDKIGEGKRFDPKLLNKTLGPSFKVGDLDGPGYIARLAAEATSVVMAKDYGLEVLDCAQRRMLEGLSWELAQAARDRDSGKTLLEQIAPIESALNALRFSKVKDDPRGNAGTRFLDKLIEAQQRGHIRGVPIVLPEIAHVLSEPSFEATNLYGLLSSSGEGKTSLMLQIARYALKCGHAVLIQSYDQNEEQIVRQMVSQALGIPTRRLRSGDVHETEVEAVIDWTNGLNQAPFEVQKCTNEDAAQLVSAARDFCQRKVESKEKPALIITDHIGSITAEDERAGEGVKAKRISGRLKSGAEETDSAWLVLQQRNTIGMARDNPRPISADLYGGEGAKQAYDAILTLYRPEKYATEKRSIAAGPADYKRINAVFKNTEKDVAELSSIKVRFGEAKRRADIIFEPEFTRYASKEMLEAPYGEQTLGGFE